MQWYVRLLLPVLVSPARRMIPSTDFLFPVPGLERTAHEHEPPENEAHDTAIRGHLNQLDAFLSDEFMGATKHRGLRQASAEAFLHLAASEGHVRMVEMLLQERQPNISVSDAVFNSRALHAAVARGHAEVVSRLVELQADVNMRVPGGFAPIHLAIRGDQRPALAALIRCKADVNALSSAGATPLHLAVLHAGEHSQSLTRELLGIGADVNIYDADKRTPLHFAVMVLPVSSHGLRQKDQLMILIEHKADLDAQDNVGRTALHYANRRFGFNKNWVADLLRRHGAKDVLDLYGRSPAELNSRLISLTLPANLRPVHAVDLSPSHHREYGKRLLEFADIIGQAEIKWTHCDPACPNAEDPVDLQPLDGRLAVRYGFLTGRSEGSPACYALESLSLAASMTGIEPLTKAQMYPEDLKTELEKFVLGDSRPNMLRKRFYGLMYDLRKEMEVCRA